MFKQSMMTLATLAVMVSLSGVSRAEGDTNESADGYRQVTCAEAMQKAWFNRELERTDGDIAHDVPVLQECSRELIAAASDAAEESK